MTVADYRVHTLTSHFIRDPLQVLIGLPLSLQNCLHLRSIVATWSLTHSSETLIHIGMTASHRCFAYSSMMQISHSTNVLYWEAIETNLFSFSSDKKLTVHSISAAYHKPITLRFLLTPFLSNSDAWFEPQRCWDSLSCSWFTTIGTDAVNVYMRCT